MSKALPLVTRHGDRIAIVNGLRTPLPNRRLPITAFRRWI